MGWLELSMTPLRRLSQSSCPGDTLISSVPYPLNMRERPQKYRVEMIIGFFVLTTETLEIMSSYFNSILNY